MKSEKPQWISDLPDTSKRAYCEYLDSIRPGARVLNYWSWVEETVGEFLKAHPKAEELEQ